MHAEHWHSKKYCSRRCWRRSSRLIRRQCGPDIIIIIIIIIIISSSSSSSNLHYIHLNRQREWTDQDHYTDRRSAVCEFNIISLQKPLLTRSLWECSFHSHSITFPFYKSNSRSLRKILSSHISQRQTTDRRQTDGRWHIAMFTFAKNDGLIKYDVQKLTPHRTSHFLYSHKWQIKNNYSIIKNHRPTINSTHGKYLRAAKDS